MTCDGHRHVGGGAASTERSIPRSRRNESGQISPPPTPQRERPALAPVPDVEREETGKEAKAVAVKPESHNISIEEAILLEGMLKESGETDPKKLMQSALGVLNLIHEYQLDGESRTKLHGACVSAADVNLKAKEEREKTAREASRHVGGSEGREVSIGTEPSRQPEPSQPAPLPESRRIAPLPTEPVAAKPPSQKPEMPQFVVTTPPTEPEQPRSPKKRSLTADERDLIAEIIRASLKEEKKITQDTPRRVREAVDVTLAAFQVKRETLDKEGEAWLKATIDEISNEIVERARTAATTQPQQKAPVAQSRPQEGKEASKAQQIKDLLSKAKSEEQTYQAKDRDSRNRWENDTIINLANLLGKREEIRNKHFRDKADIVRRALVPAIFPSQEQLRVAAPKFIMPPPQRPPQQGYGRRW